MSSNKAKLASDIAQAFRDLGPEEKLYLEGAQLSKGEIGKGYGLQGVSTAGFDAFKAILNTISQGIEAGRPEIELLDKLRTHAWSKNVIKANPALIADIEVIEHQYLEKLSHSITAESIKLYTSIPEQDMFSKETTPAKKALAHMLNNLSSWVASDIALEPDIDKRALKAKRWQTVAIQNMEQKNFTGVMAIIGAFNHASIKRMAATLDSVPVEIRQKFAELQKFGDPSDSFKAMKVAMQLAFDEGAPLIPFSGIMETDVTFTWDFNTAIFAPLVKNNQDIEAINKWLPADMRIGYKESSTDEAVRLSADMRKLATNREIISEVAAGRKIVAFFDETKERLRAKPQQANPFYDYLKKNLASFQERAENEQKEIDQQIPVLQRTLTLDKLLYKTSLLHEPRIKEGEPRIAPSLIFKELGWKPIPALTELLTKVARFIQKVTQKLRTEEAEAATHPLTAIDPINKVVATPTNHAMAIKTYEEWLKNPEMADVDTFCKTLFHGNSLPEWLTARPNAQAELLSIFKGSEIGAIYISKHRPSLELIAQGKKFEEAIDVLTEYMKQRAESYIYHRLDPDAAINTIYINAGSPIDGESTSATNIRLNLTKAILDYQQEQKNNSKQKNNSENTIGTPQVSTKG